MSDQTLQRITSEFLRMDFENSSFAWQGGEPMLMGLDFYKKAVDFQQELGKNGQLVSNALQTNGTLLDDTWCKFLREYKFLVGISLDGPKHIHDHYRRDFADRGTFDRVMNGINCCKANKVEYNILVLLSDNNIDKADELFDFFTSLGVEYLQFIPCIETDNTGQLNKYSVTDMQYADFMCRIFDRWLEYGYNKISIRMFDSLMNYVLNGFHTNCSFCKQCDQYIVLEHNGNAYCCDFFVDEQYKLGNIMETTIDQLYLNEIKKDFANSKKKLANKCFICRYSNLCRGGCLKDRIANDGKVNSPSSLCAGYKKIFDHTVGKLKQLTAEIVKNSQKP